MATWLPFLKGLLLYLFLAPTFFTTRTIFWLYKHRQALRRTLQAQTGENTPQQHALLWEGILWLILSFLLFVLFIVVEVLTGASLETIIGLLIISIIGIALLSAMLIVFESSKLRYQE